MPTQTRTIRVVVDTKQAQGLRRLSNQFGRMNRSVKSVESSLGGLRRVFQAAIAGLGVRELTRSADAFQLLRDRIRVFTGSAEVANDVFGDIVTLAARTKSSVESFAEAYNRVAIATKGLGLNSDQTLGIVTALQQSLRLSGATAQEASSVFIQLSQALSLGRLQGQELRAVLLSNATVANILAKEFGVTTGQLKELGEQGRITSDRVIKALAANFENLNDQANKLGTTFQQSTIILLDQFRVKIDQLNTRFDLNSKFFKGISFLIDNLETLFQVLTVLVGAGLFVKLASQINVLSASLTTAIATNGSLLQAFGLTRLATFALGAALTFLSTEALKDFEKFQLQVDRGLLKLSIGFAEVDTFIFRLANKLATLGSLNPLKPLVGTLKALSEADLEKLNKQLNDVELQLGRLSDNERENSPDKILERINQQLKGFDSSGVAGTTGEFGKLNAQLKQNLINLEDYRVAVDNIQIDLLVEKFNQGKITLDQFTDSLFKIRTAFDDLSGGQQVLLGIERGAAQAARNIGSIASEIANSTTSVFNELEDRLVDFIKTGRFEFKDFAQFIADELTRVTLRLTLIRSLTQATTSFVGGFANGGVFQNGKVQPFANGGVVSSPTLFPLANGTGLMGEAGPEAILPLRRGPGGRLGVESSGGGGTVVNIVNNSSAQIEQRESTNSNGEVQIDVVIVDRVNKAIREGKMDKTFGQTYGLTRRGV